MGSMPAAAAARTAAARLPARCMRHAPHPRLLLGRAAAAGRLVEAPAALQRAGACIVCTSASELAIGWSDVLGWVLG